MPAARKSPRQCANTEGGSPVTPIIVAPVQLAHNPTSSHTHPVADIGDDQQAPGKYLDGSNAWLPVPVALVPANAQSASYTVTTADVGKAIEMTGSSAQVVTIADPAPATGYATGATLTIVRYGTGTVTITPGAGVTLLSPDAQTGARSIATVRGVATLRHRGANEWLLHGDLA